MTSYCAGNLGHLVKVVSVKSLHCKIIIFPIPFFFFFKRIYLFIYFWLPWVFVVARSLSLAAARGVYSSLR